MKYREVDWANVFTYAQEVYEGCQTHLIKPFQILKTIEEGFERSRELTDLNLPIYVIYPPEHGEKEKYPKAIELHLPEGTPTYVPIKEVVSIGGIAPCNMAIAVMQNAVEEANRKDNTAEWVTLIDIRTKHSGSYYALLTRTVYEDLMNFWHVNL